jgi:hypothetical protein
VFTDPRPILAERAMAGYGALPATSPALLEFAVAGDTRGLRAGIDAAQII